MSQVDAAPLAVSGGDVKGELEWPDEWVVFGPFHRAHPVINEDVLSSVPETIELEPTSHLPGLELKGHRISAPSVEPVNLADYEFFEDTQRTT